MRRGLSREFLGQISDLGTLPVLKWQMGMSQNGDIYIYSIYIIIYTYIYTPHKVDFDLILTGWIDDSKPIDLRYYVSNCGFS